MSTKARLDVYLALLLLHSYVQGRVLFITFDYSVWNFYFGCCNTVSFRYADMVQVCVGDVLEFTCNITGTLLQWHIPLIGSSHRFQYGISASDSASAEAHNYQLIDNSTINTIISIISAEDSPVSSTLLISPVTESHNGTEMICVDLNSSPTMESSTTIIIFERQYSLHRGWIL